MDLSRPVGRLLGVRPALVDAGGGGAARAPDGAAAIVVGGGIAGMSAAVVLAERGVRVTLLEALPWLGGRLAAWPDRLADGTPQMVEHGFHAFFRQYYNWRAILRRVDPELDFLRPVPEYPVLSARWPAEDFGRLPAAPPLNLLALLARSPSLRLRDLRTMDGQAALPLLAYDPERTVAVLGTTTAAELLDSMRLPDRARAMLFEVFSHSFFNLEADYSAAEMVANFHFYLLGNPEGLAFDAPYRDYDAAIWQPLARHVEARGCRVVTGRPVVAVDRDGAAWKVETEEHGYAAPHLVLAVDPTALTALVGGSPALSTALPMLAEPDAFPAGPPYAVARYWFGGDVRRDRPIFAGVSRQPTLDSVTLYHRLESEAGRWARRTGGSVIELHAYACPPDLPAEELAGRMRRELAGLWPEVAGLPVVELRARVEARAPAFRPGGHHTRPSVVTGVGGLYLAGDGIHAPFPSALMERSAVTGILAANEILRSYGAATESLRSIRPRGLLADRVTGRPPRTPSRPGRSARPRRPW